MRQDQIGGALKALLPEVLHGRFHLEALRAIALFARDYYMGWRIAGYVVPISFAILFLLLPLSGWFKDRSQFRLNLSMLMITIAAALVPAVMFYVDSFSEGNFAVFLEVSFDRACFPAIILLVVNAVLILSAALEPNRAASFEAK
jgi:hypothetical protein